MSLNLAPLLHEQPLDADAEGVVHWDWRGGLCLSLVAERPVQIAVPAVTPPPMTSGFLAVTLENGGSLAWGPGWYVEERLQRAMYAPGRAVLIEWRFDIGLWLCRLAQGR